MSELTIGKYYKYANPHFPLVVGKLVSIGSVSGYICRYKLEFATGEKNPICFMWADNQTELTEATEEEVRIYRSKFTKKPITEHKQLMFEF